jgi:hypothetical protein
MTYLDRGKWAQAGIPHKGWICTEIVDTEDRDHVCEMCEQQECRYVHRMIWVDVATARVVHDLACGSVCAEHMTNDYSLGRRMVSAAKRRATMTEESLLERVLAGRRSLDARYPFGCTDCKIRFPTGIHMAWDPKRSLAPLCWDCVLARVKTSRTLVRPEEIR